MATLAEIQKQIRKRRETFKLADKEYYQALQKFSLSAAQENTEEQNLIKEKLKKREDTRLDLHAAINLLTQSDGPQQLLKQISSDIPILLFPVRVEARYLTTRYVVRKINPDDWIDTSESNLGFEKDENGNPSYQIPQLKRNLFNSLSLQVKSGRIGPKSNQYIERKPDKDELCIRIYPDEILKHAQEAFVTPLEWESGISFWKKICSKTESEETVWLDFSTGIPTARAAWIARVTRPKNYTFGEEIPDQLDFPEPNSIKDGAFTLPPTVYLLPERIVVRLFSSSGNFKEFTGKAIPEPVRLGLDPTDDPFNEHPESSSFSDDNNSLTVPSYLQWIQDLEKAEEEGLAIRINLKEHSEFRNGVEKIVVLGLKLSANEEESSQLLSEHFENCLFKEDGLEILPQGTPTNNFGEKKSGLDLRENASKAYFRTVFQQSIEREKKGSDEFFLRYFLGLPEHLRLPKGNRQDISEAKLMNGMLWHATWGYYLLQFFSPSLKESKREALRQFFKEYVTAQGLLPAIRINEQPYGIVLTTQWALWKAPKDTEEDQFLADLWDGYLSKLKEVWKTAASKITSVSNINSSNENLDAEFMGMLGQTASSSQIHGQILSGQGLKSILQKLLDHVNAALKSLKGLSNQLATISKEISKKENERKLTLSKIAMLSLSLNRPLFPKRNEILRQREALTKQKNKLEEELKKLKGEKINLEKKIKSSASRSKALSSNRTQLSQAINTLKGFGLSDLRNLFNSLPNILEDLFYTQQTELIQTLIDSLPASEERSQEKMPGKSWNYIEWLLHSKLTDVWNQTFESAPNGEGEEESLSHNSLFSLMSRQAVLRAWLESQLRIQENKIGPWLLKAKDFDLQHLDQLDQIQLNPQALDTKNLIHQQFKAIVNAYKEDFSSLVILERDKRKYIKDSASLNIQELNQKIGNELETQAMKELEKALFALKDLPTARLERLFLEHLDLCSYRLDAWMSGLLFQRLDQIRQSKPREIILGAFGYLEGLKPKNPRDIVVEEIEPNLIPANPRNFEKAAIPIVNSKIALQRGIDLNKSQDQVFFYIGEQENPRIWLNASGKVEPDPLINQSPSDGFIHMPSLAHATTAAIMRAGYLAHQADNQTETLSINLTAPRVKKAMDLLGNMQAGASLAEVLGHHFERALHELNLDGFRFEFRKAFPLKSKENTGSEIPLMESLDGLALLNTFNSQPNTWLNILKDKKGKPLAISPNNKGLLTNLAQSLEDDYLDSTGDLLLTESLFQTAKGNTDRAASALKTLNTGGRALLPEFVQVPQKAYGFVHKVGIVFPNLNPADPGNSWTPQASPRTLIAPTLNKWIAKQLPSPDHIWITVLFPENDPVRFKLSDLEIEPIDLLYSIPSTFRKKSPSSLDLWVLQKLIDTPQFKKQKDKNYRIDYTDRNGFKTTEFSIYELSALIVGIKNTISSGTALQPRDFNPEGKSMGKLHLLPLEEELKNQIKSNSAASKLINSLHKEVEIIQEAMATDQLSEIPVSSFTRLSGAFCQASLFGIPGDSGEYLFRTEADQLAMLKERTEIIANKLTGKLNHVKSILEELSPIEEQRFEQLGMAAKELFGKEFHLFPIFELDSNEALQSAFEKSKQLKGTDLEEIDQWICDVALVRKSMNCFHQLTQLRELFPGIADAFKEPTITQFPFSTAIPWIGQSIKERDLENMDPDLRPSISFVLEHPEEFKLNQPISGILSDDWSEFIPESTTDTAVTFQYNQPNTEPPQTMLLAISPELGDHWSWENLIGSVEEAMEMAKSRLVTPTQLSKQNQVLGEILPAIVVPFLNQHGEIPESDVTPEK